MGGPVEPGQYTSYAFTQVLDDHGVLASIGTVSDALDNALAESFVDSFKTELIAQRVWRRRTQLELAVVEYIGWFNHDRLQKPSATSRPSSSSSSTGAQAPFSANGSVAVIAPRAADRSYAPRLELKRASDPPTALSATTDPRPASPASLS